MEGAGTDYDYRISRLEKGFQELSGVASDLHTMVARLDNSNANVTKTLEKLDAKLDEQRTKKPQLGAVLGVVFSGLGVSAILMASILSPIQGDLAEHGRELDYINQTSWTRGDNQRTIDQLSKEIETEITDLQHQQRRQDDRINELMKEVYRGNSSKTNP